MHKTDHMFIVLRDQNLPSSYRLGQSNPTNKPQFFSVRGGQSIYGAQITPSRFSDADVIWQANHPPAPPPP